MKLKKLGVVLISLLVLFVVMASFATWRIISYYERWKAELLKEAEATPRGQELLNGATSGDGKVDLLGLKVKLLEEDIKRRDATRKIIDDADELTDQGNFEKAEKKLTEALQSETAIRQQVIKSRGFLYARSGQFNKAVADYTEALKHLPDSSHDAHSEEMLLEVRGHAYEMMQDYMKAIEDLTAVLALTRKNKTREASSSPDALPQDREASLLQHRAKLFMLSNQASDAINDLVAATKLEISPKIAKVIYFQKGLLERKLNKLNEMQADWKEAKRLGSNLAEEQHSDNERETKWTWYYPTGPINAEGGYLDGKREGPYVLYYQNGQIKKKGSYHEDKPIGEWVTYNEDGSIKETKTF